MVSQVIGFNMVTEAPKEMSQFDIIKEERIEKYWSLGSYPDVDRKGFWWGIPFILVLPTVVGTLLQF